MNFLSYLVPFLYLFTKLLVTASNSTLKLTEEVFYKADISQYTVDFCSKVTSNDFILSVKSSNRENEKPAAFKAFFDGCRNRFLYDADMAKHVIVQMVYTGNTEYLPLLLDKGQKLTSTPGAPTYDNIDMDKEIIKLVEYYLFVVNAFPTENTHQYFFLLRHPERSLAYILAYTNVSKSRLEELRDLLENLSNHPSKSEYVDAKSIDKAIILADGYLKKPELVGNHKFLLSTKVIEDEQFNEKDSGDWIMIFGIILSFGAVLAIVLGLLWKLQGSQEPTISE
jgi:hypothetical protein